MHRPYECLFKEQQCEDTYRPNFDAFSFLISGDGSLIVVGRDKQKSKEGSSKGKKVAQRPMEIAQVICWKAADQNLFEFLTHVTWP